MSTEQIMEEVISIFKEVENDWEKLKDRQNAAAGRRIRKSLDEVARIKVDLRKVMLAEERS